MSFPTRYVPHVQKHASPTMKQDTEELREAHTLTLYPLPVKRDPGQRSLLEAIIGIAIRA